VLCSSTDLNFGECNSSQFSVQVADISDITGSRIQVYELIDGYDEEVMLFTGYVDSAKMQSDGTYRKIIAYDELNRYGNIDVTAWYQSQFETTTKDEYQGEWTASGRYLAGQVVKEEDTYYRYLCSEDNSLLITTYDEEDNEVETTYNVADYLVGKKPSEIVDDDETLNYIQELDSYCEVNYGTITLKAFRDSLFAYIGLEQGETSLINDDLAITYTTDSTMTFLDCIQAICQVGACFGHIDETGVFQYVQLGNDTVDYTGNFQEVNTTYEEYAVNVIDRVEIYDSLSELLTSCGDGSNAWSLTSNFLLYSLDNVQAVAEKLYDAVKDITYTPTQLNAILSLPISLGCKVTFTAHTGAVVTTYTLEDSLSDVQLTSQTITANGNQVRATQSSSLAESLNVLEQKTTSLVNGLTTKITADLAEIKQIYGDLANYKVVMAGKVQAQYAEIEKLSANEADFEKATAEEFEAVRGEIKDLDVGTLTAKVAEIDEAYIDKESVNTLLADYATVENLNATNATVKTLSGDMTSFIDGDFQNLSSKTANIENILAGNVGTGDLQAINLTSANVTIDEAVIKGLIASKISVGDLATYSATAELIQLITQDGKTSIAFSGATQQFYDSDGNVRVQIGQDNNGDFNFVIRGADGKTALFDETGIKTSAIADGLIVNDMISDSTISKDKLGFEVIEPNEQGGIDITQVYDGNGGLFGVEYTSFKESTEESLSSLDDKIEDSLVYNVEIWSSNGNVFKNGEISTTLSCHVFRSNVEITDEINASKFKWTKINNDGSLDEDWNAKHFGGVKEIEVTAQDVYTRATFECHVEGIPETE
jgi:hypothetical protein